MKNILIAVSGTGGHVYPGIALAYELQQKGYNPVFVVNNNKNGVSLKIVSTSGYSYEILDFKAPPRKISLDLILFPFRFVKTLFTVKRMLNRLSPKVVVGMGAYLSFPVLLMAKFKKIPTLIHEQNSIPGLANRLLSKIVTKVAISFKNSGKFFNRKKTIFTSNPIRKDIFNISRKDAAKKLNLDADIFTIFIFGGSLGATKLNNIMFNVNEYLFNRHKDKIQFIHITGNNDFENLDNKYQKLNTKKFITKYMNDIGNAYACSDLVICRAGAGTVKEVENYNLPTLFIPFPYATDNHQYFNAKSVEVPNFRVVTEEKNITEQEIIKFIEQYISDVIDIDRIVSPDFFPQEILAKEVLKLTNEKI
ncbi:undecaprenyldiphospho-muramoylpentapeptide beta-N-acetylglucosaminyltransferase [Candidatus Ruminimicrobiellum ovillum]|uniref:undecaprenyldiphospho-muramoylpentapeptide beta-N-acetylglucosaminyltransferase n=1 Tax=Candidatus Ruminimicrobiellum ovillum TaxID=1947927 RepID=UPI00355A59A3